MDEKDRIVDEAHKLKDDVDLTIKLSWDFLKRTIVAGIVLLVVVIIASEMYF